MGLLIVLTYTHPWTLYLQQAFAIHQGEVIHHTGFGSHPTVSGPETMKGTLHFKIKTMTKRNGGMKKLI